MVAGWGYEDLLGHHGTEFVGGEPTQEPDSSAGADLAPDCARAAMGYGGSRALMHILPTRNSESRPWRGVGGRYRIVQDRESHSCRIVKSLVDDVRKK